MKVTTQLGSFEGTPQELLDIADRVESGAARRGASGVDDRIVASQIREAVHKWRVGRLEAEYDRIAMGR